MSMNISEMISVAEGLGWSVSGYRTVEMGIHTCNTYEFQQHTPAGEDFCFTVDIPVDDFGEPFDDDDLWLAVRRYARDFDINEHVKGRLENQDSTSGVPDATTLVEDAHDIVRMINELADAMQGIPAQHSINIREIAHELYRQDWIISHVSKDSLLSTIREYYSDPDNYDGCPLETWVQEHGFPEGIYACMDEFLESEYLDITYMVMLLAREQFIQMYLEDLTNHEMECGEFICPHCGANFCNAIDQDEQGWHTTCPVCAETLSTTMKLLPRWVV